MSEQAVGRLGTIFDIKRFALHDGPGSRTTVFFKGCPLRCWWCHNPESLQARPQLVYNRKKCLLCADCVAACEPRALHQRKDRIDLERNRCNLCRRCLAVCSAEALEIIGRQASVSDVMSEIERDVPFYDQSGGGVTFSGGEPLQQPEFLQELLAACRQRSIPTVLDTSGYGSPDTLRAIFDQVNHVLYDLKIMDDRQHRRHTGVSNRLILENLEMISRRAGKQRKIAIRIPLIPGITDSDENIAAISDFLRPLKNIKEIGLLNYHRGGRQKYEKLGLPDRLKQAQPLADERVAAIGRVLSRRGFQVSVGG